MQEQDRKDGAADEGVPHGSPPAGLHQQATPGRAQSTTGSLKGLFSRGNHHPQVWWQAATGVAQRGWHFNRSAPVQKLSGQVVGYEVPLAGPSGAPVSPVLATTLLACIHAVEENGGWLAPFTVGQQAPAQQRGVPRTAGLTPEEWLLRYANGLGPGRYRQVARERAINAFLVDAPILGDPRLAALDEIGMPYVVLGSPEWPDRRFFVDVDDAAGFTLMVERLLTAGCDAGGVAHYGFTDDGTVVPGRRRQAVAAALGRTPDAVTRRTRHFAATDDEAEVARLTAWLRQHRPHAVVCDCDSMAALVARAADRAGQRIAATRQSAADLLLAGCDDAPVRRTARTPWMSLRHPSQSWASAAAELLVEAIRGLPPRHVLVSPILVAPPPMVSTNPARHRPPLPR